MKLIKPSKEYEQSWKDAIAEFEAEGIGGFWNLPKKPQDLYSYIRRIEDHALGKNLPASLVPSTTYWLLDKGEFVGHVNIRHSYNEKLRDIGGLIGYAIRPSMRRKGYGTKILELALTEIKKFGLQKILITCDESNIGSQKVIEKNGGIYENSLPSENGPKRRYWIEI